MKVIAILLAFTMLPACREPSTTWSHVEDEHTPDKYERLEYWERCIGQPRYSENPLSDDLRVACVKAVLGSE